MADVRKVGKCAICGVIREVLADHTMPMHAPITRTLRRCSGAFLLPAQLWLVRAGRRLSTIDPRTGEPIPRADVFTDHMRRR
jgi:hypothetical protein